MKMFRKTLRKSEYYIDLTFNIQTVLFILVFFFDVRSKTIFTSCTLQIQIHFALQCSWQQLTTGNFKFQINNSFLLFLTLSFFFNSVSFAHMKIPFAYHDEC